MYALYFARPCLAFRRKNLQRTPPLLIVDMPKLFRFLHKSGHGHGHGYGHGVVRQTTEFVSTA